MVLKYNTSTQSRYMIHHTSISLTSGTPASSLRSRNFSRR